MSDANMPPKDQGSSESLNPAYPDRLAEDHDPMEDTEFSPESAADVEPDWEDWQVVTFPNALDVRALTQPSPDANETLDPQQGVEPDWQMQSPPSEPEPPRESEALVVQSNYLDRHTTVSQIEELLSLVRDLNQCNDALLGRVRLLEEELATCQMALEIESGRSQEQASLLIHKDDALATAQSQVTQLTNDLEFAQQTAQRHAIRIETLSDQLETSHQRIAQLERECALIQQRNQEQAQALREANDTCRDLRSRLQRQQRYTLQFKVALEKCLDVPPPRYQVAEPIEQQVSSAPRNPEQPLSSEAQALVPKVQQIQPWSVQSPTAGHKFDWLPPDADPLAQAALETDIPSDTTSSSDGPNLFADLDQPEATDLQDEDIEVEPSSISYDLNLADTATDQADVAQRHTAEPEVNLPKAAEDALWQDLARLIDASVEAGSSPLAQDEITFESSSTPVDPAEAIAAGWPFDPHETPQAQHAEAEVMDEWATETQFVPEPQAETMDDAIAAEAPTSSGSGEGSSQSWIGAFNPKSSWPSPVVYPLRPQKRRTSMASVELPSFPRRSR